MERMDLDPAVSTAGDETRQRPKSKRSRNGCNTCRARKVKCDERPNGCANCEKLHLDCAGYSRTPIPRHNTAKRTVRSCNDCRIARCKCSGEQPTCKRCRENSLHCLYEGVTERISTTSYQPVATDEMPSNASNGSALSPRLDSSSHASASVAGSQLPWLNSPGLPNPKQIRVLVNSYFQNFHPLRCFAFIHKPTFSRNLDDRVGSSLRDDALLHIMCTIGAQFFALEYSDTVQPLPVASILHAGSQWARTAQRLLFENTDKITVDGLMTAQLLYDYALRMANFAQAFIISALMARMSQALQINLEYSSDLLNQPNNAILSATARECRRRMMWSVYVTDVLLGSGVDQLTLIHEKDLKIQLPYNEWAFLHERPCITKTLNGEPLPFIPPEILPAHMDGNLGLLGFFVQQTEIRRRVLRYIKHLSKAQPPWLQESEFAQLDAELRNWYEALPENLEFTTSTIYMRQESFQLGALCLFHCAYHQTVCDLYRIGTPALYKLRSAFQFPPEKSDFQRQLRWALFKEARTLAAIIGEGLRHGPWVIGDTWLPTIAYDSNRIMLFYLTQISETPGMSKRELVLRTIPYLQSNLKALKAMRAVNAVADGLSRAAETMLDKLGVDSNRVLPLPNIILDDPYLAFMNRNEQSVPGTPPQSAPDYVLNPLSIFRMARSHIPEGHAPETTPGFPEVVHPLQSNTSDSSTMEHLTVSSIGDKEAYDSMEGFNSILDMFCAPDAELDWQSADMLVGSNLDSVGVLQWTGTSQLGDYVFDPSH